MTFQKTSAVLACVAALLTSTAALANDKDVVKTAGNQIVRATNGTCVLTQWDASGVCDHAAAPVAAPAITKELRTVYFDFNSATLTPSAKAKLDTLSTALAAKEADAVQIVGYADKIGGAPYNVKLSLRRAAAVGDYLISKGIAVSGKSHVRGLGQTASQSACDGVNGNALKACLWRDRRVEVEIVK